MKDLLEVFTESSSLCQVQRLGQQLPAGFCCSTAEKRNSGANRLIRNQNNLLSERIEPPLSEIRIRNYFEINCRSVVFTRA